MSVKRYSGRAVITLRFVERDEGGDQFVYPYSVSVGGKSVARGTVSAPRSGFGRGVAYDSAKAFDESARAALSFAMDDNSDIADVVEYDDSGVHISRRRPARASRPNKAPKSAKRLAKPKRKACSAAASVLKTTKGRAGRSWRRVSKAAQTTRTCASKFRPLADAATRKRNAKRRAKYRASKR